MDILSVGTPFDYIFPRDSIILYEETDGSCINALKTKLVWELLLLLDIAV